MQIAASFPWWVHALCAAVCAAAIPVLGRFGLKSVPSDLATVLRSLATTAVLLVLATRTHAWSAWPAARASGVRGVSAIVLCGVAGALSWLFYFKALSAAEASRVAPVDKLSVPFAVILGALLLGERPSALNWVGVALTCVGVLLAAAPAR